MRHWTRDIRRETRGGFLHFLHFYTANIHPSNQDGGNDGEDGGAAQWPRHFSFIVPLRTAMKADCGTLTWPNSFILALPRFCFSRTFIFRVTSPP